MNLLYEDMGTFGSLRFVLAVVLSFLVILMHTVSKKFSFNVMKKVKDLIPKKKTTCKERLKNAFFHCQASIHMMIGDFLILKDHLEHQDLNSDLKLGK